MELTIVTGASRGIGEQLVQQIRATGNRAIGVARTVDKGIDQVTLDLTRIEKASAWLTECLLKEKERVSSLTLIHNAGIVDPIGLIGEVDGEMIEKAFQVNTIAPIALTNIFLQATADFTGSKKIVFISSGAGRKVYEGWGTYCSTKAAIDHFASVVAVEQKKQKYPTQIVSLAPGIIDTSMQEVIRSSGDHQFPMLEQFIAYKEQGLLSSAEETASKIARYLQSEQFGEQVIADIREIAND